EGEELYAKWAWPEEVKKGRITWTEDSLDFLPEFPSFRAEYIDPARKFPRQKEAYFSEVDSIAVMSDIHGQFDAARKLLMNAGVMNEDHEWTYGHGHLVIVGDIFDRGPAVNETLWLIHNLQQDATKSGGRVHFLLGNHETMILSGDVRYMHKRYLRTTALLTTPYHELYGKDAYLGRWLRSLPLTIRINDLVFVHGGFSKELLREIPSLFKINDIYHKHLIDTDDSFVISESERLALLQGRDGPLWYRGYFLDREFTENDITKILKKLKANRMVVGHTSFDAIRSYFNGKVLAVDSSIKFGSTGEILLIEHGELKRTTLFGETHAVVAAEDKRQK
ncbi:MAG: metallophosphoesterase, partial [Bacteroidota bacterium]